MGMTNDFRAAARGCLERARALLQTDNSGAVRYAALELRMALEALTYGRAAVYADDLPASGYRTWQPRKVLQLLLSMDPNADQGAALAIGIEETYGQPAKDMQSMGKEHVLSFTTIKRHYDALGSYLHFPTMEQCEKGDTPSLAGLRDRCNALVEEISKVLSSPIYNLRFKLPLVFECCRCGSPISKGMPPGAQNVDVRCTHCNALHKLSHDVASKETTIKPVVKQVPCSDLECERKVELWDDEISVGVNWACPDCSRRNIFALVVAHHQK